MSKPSIKINNWILICVSLFVIMLVAYICLSDVTVEPTNVYIIRYMDEICLPSTLVYIPQSMWIYAAKIRHIETPLKPLCSILLTKVNQFYKTNHLVISDIQSYYSTDNTVPCYLDIASPYTALVCVSALILRINKKVHKLKPQTIIFIYTQSVNRLCIQAHNFLQFKFSYNYIHNFI